MNNLNTQPTSRTLPLTPISKKISLKLKLALIVGLGLLVVDLIIQGLQLAGDDFIDRPGLWRIGAIARSGFFIDLTAACIGGTWLLFHTLRRQNLKINFLIKSIIWLLMVLLVIPVILFSAMAIRSTLSIFSSPVSYDGSCTVSYSYYSRGGVPGGTVSYYLKIPDHHDSFGISQTAFEQLSQQPKFNGKGLQVANQFSPDYPCVSSVHMQYISNEDTIIDLKLDNRSLL